MQFQLGLWQHMEDALNDLHFLTFAAQARRLAVQDASARLLLPEIQANHAVYLAGFQRYAEAARKAHGALRLLQEEDTRLPFALLATLVSAQTAVYGGAKPRPQHGIHRLQAWEQHTRDPAMQAWVMADRAEYLALAGHAEVAIQLSRRACEVAEQGGEREVLQRRRDLAHLLLRAQKPTEALEVAMRLPLEVPFWRARVCLIRAEALLRLGERNEAQTWLERALMDIDAYALQNLHDKAAALARQL